MKNNYIALELLLDGVDSQDIITRSNKKAPFDRKEEDLQPEDPTIYEVRFARHIEYQSNPTINTADCGIITPLVTPDAVMYRSSLGIGQIPTVERPLLCPFDVYLWVPNKHDCDIRVKQGSRAIDGVRGARLNDEIRCTVPSLSTGGSVGGISPSPPPPSPSSLLSPPPLSPPPSPAGPPPPLSPPSSHPPLSPNHELVYTVTGTLTVDDATDYKEATFKEGIVSELNEEWSDTFGDKISAEDVSVSTTTLSGGGLQVTVVVSGLTSPASDHVVDSFTNVTRVSDISSSTGTNITSVGSFVPSTSSVRVPHPPPITPPLSPASSPPPVGLAEPMMVFVGILSVASLCCCCFLVGCAFRRRGKRGSEEDTAQQDAEKGRRAREGVGAGVSTRDVNVRMSDASRPRSTAIERARAANEARRNAALGGMAPSTRGSAYSNERRAGNYRR